MLDIPDRILRFIFFSIAAKHPDQKFSLTIRIPDENVADLDKYFNK